LVLAVSTIGHLSSGFLLGAGVPVWTNIAAAFAGFALSGSAIYAGALPPQGVSLIAALALGVGGLAPGAIYAAAPHAAPAPAAVPPTIGLVQQASNLGQFAGPGDAGPVGGTLRLAGCTGHRRAGSSFRTCLRIHTSPHPDPREMARTQCARTSL
jgi:hypothetical protein